MYANTHLSIQNLIRKKTEKQRNLKRMAGKSSLKISNKEIQWPKGAWEVDLEEFKKEITKEISKEKVVKKKWLNMKVEETEILNFNSSPSDRE